MQSWEQSVLAAPPPPRPTLGRAGKAGAGSTEAALNSLLGELAVRLNGDTEPNNCSLHSLPTSSGRQPDLLLSDPNNCCLHQLAVTNGDRFSNSGGQDMVGMFSRAPLSISRASKQYVYDESGTQYLDCVNGTAHVGHCHPQVVQAGKEQMGKLVTAQGFVSKVLKKYVNQLVESLPDPLNVCYLTNSGSEANDLALRLARAFTGQQDLITTQDGYHGNLGVLVDVSPKMHPKIPGYTTKPHVQVVPAPDLYRGKHSAAGPTALDKYVGEVEEAIRRVEAQGRKVAAFILEPFFVIAGVLAPPPGYLESVCRLVRSHGGLVIADEVQTGLGRTGEMWGFMNTAAVPDIVTVGKPLGNGHPMGAVVCSREISERLGGYFSTFGGNPVSCAIGLTVLEVIRNEKLACSAKMVGRHLHSTLVGVRERHACLGSVRGAGLVLGLEVVDPDSGQPDPDLTTEIMYGMKARQVLVGITGRDRNVLLFTPPMCFNIDNSRKFCQALGEVLDLLAEKRGRLGEARQTSVIVSTGRLGGKRSLLQPEPEEAASKRSRQQEPGRQVEEQEEQEDNYYGMD